MLLHVAAQKLQDVDELTDGSATVANRGAPTSEVRNGILDAISNLTLRRVLGQRLLDEATERLRYLLNDLAVRADFERRIEPCERRVDEPSEFCTSSFPDRSRPARALRQRPGEAARSDQTRRQRPYK